MNQIVCKDCGHKQDWVGQVLCQGCQKRMSNWSVASQLALKPRNNDHEDDGG